LEKGKARGQHIYNEKRRRVVSREKKGGRREKGKKKLPKDTSRKEILDQKAFEK